jgi:hypothetical protein
MPSIVISALALPAGGLHLDPREPEPSLDQVARQVNVLDAAEGQMDLAPKRIPHFIEIPRASNR